MRRRGQRGTGDRRFVLVASVLLSFALCPLYASAQAPDIRPRVDLAVTLQYQRSDDASTARLYTPLGRPSTVGLTVVLETGYNLVVSERLQRLPKDSEIDIFDEAYLEDPGILRIGKQYLPFGRGRIINESVIAARIDSNLIAERFPVSFAYAGAGEGRQNGGLIHFGRSLGATLYIGEHLGIAGTSLGVVRPPEFASGRGGGWSQAFGFDASRRIGKLALSAEFASLNGGPDPALSVLDFEANYFSDGYRSIGLGITSAAGGQDGFLMRVFGRVRAARNLDVEPFVRLRNGRLFDAAVTLRLRI